MINLPKLAFILSVITAACLTSNLAIGQEFKNDTISFQNGVTWLCRVTGFTYSYIRIEKSYEDGGGEYSADIDKIRTLRGPNAKKMLPADLYAQLSSGYVSFGPNTRPQSGFRDQSSKYDFRANKSETDMPTPPLSSRHSPYKAVYVPMAAIGPEDWRKQENSIDLAVGFMIPLVFSSDNGPDYLSSKDSKLLYALKAQVMFRTHLHEKLDLLVLTSVASPRIAANIIDSRNLTNGYQGNMFIATALVGPSFKVIDQRRFNLNVYGAAGFSHNYLSIENSNSGLITNHSSTVSNSGSNAACYAVGSNIKYILPYRRGLYSIVDINYYYSSPQYDFLFIDNSNYNAWQDPKPRPVSISKEVSLVSFTIGAGLYF